MKVGDMVRQGERVVVMKGRAPSTALGVVVEIKKIALSSAHKRWEKILGKNTVTVLWESGRLTKDMAENSLEVIDEPG
jgi:hypothetical protein